MIGAALLALTLSTSAQTPPPVNPSEIQLDDPDYALSTDYEVGYFVQGASAPTQTQKFTKPALNADGHVHLFINSRPLGLGQYELQVRSYVGATFSAWGRGGPNGDQPVPFARALSQPVNLLIVR